MDNVKIGKLIAECRKKKKMTQKDLAELLGVTDKSVSKWENGICLPDVSLYMELCSVLGITLNEFFMGERIKDDNFKEKADQNLLKVLESSTFSLQDRIKYYERKWKKEHFFDLCVSMIIFLILFFLFRNSKDIIIIIIIGGFLWSIIRYNKMMAYIESHAYKNDNDQKTS